MSADLLRAFQHLPLESIHVIIISSRTLKLKWYTDKFFTHKVFHVADSLLAVFYYEAGVVGRGDVFLDPHSLQVKVTSQQLCI